MKILCDTQVVNRQLPQAKPIRSTKSTLAIGLHSSSSSGASTSAAALNPNPSKSSEVFIIHFSTQNKFGYRYKVENNIRKLYTNFINDGKLTISFKVPEHDLQIRCDPIQLKCFLRILKSTLGANNVINSNNTNDINLNHIIGLKTLATTPISDKLKPIYKLIIKKPSDIPIRGFPKTLTELQISNINSNRINPRILELRNLTILNLSDNNIKQIPIELGNLNLIELNISSNKLGYDHDMNDHEVNVKIKYQQKWDWLNCKQIRKSLKYLDLSNNYLKYFPYNIVKLDELTTLKLSNNIIKKIPFGIRRLNKLRYLYLDSNFLNSVPYTISYLKLDVLNVWHNKFLPLTNFDKIEYKYKQNYKIQPLWVKAGQVVLNKRIPYSSSTIPSLLVDFLSEMPLCICGKLCYSDETNQIVKRITLLKLDNIKQILYSDRDHLLYADVVFCSEKCFNKNSQDLSFAVNF